MGGRSDTALRRWALLAFGFVVALAIVNPWVERDLVGNPALAHNGRSVDYADSVYCLLMAGSGLLILWFRPRHSVGWLMTLAGALEGLCTFGQSYGARSFAVPEEGLPAGTWALSLSAPLWVPSAFILVTLVLARYPTGHVQGRWARRVDRATVASFFTLWVGYAGGDHSVQDEVPSALPPVRLPELVQGLLLFPSMAVIVGGAVFSIVHAARRAWRAGYPERQQLAWLLTVTPTAVAALFVPWDGFQRIFYLIPVAIAVGVFRYGLAGIEVVVRRTLLYGTLTGLVLLVFVAVTAGLSSVLPTGRASELVAALLVAVGVVPLRDRLQRLVDRFVYGDRGDPLTALTRLAGPLGVSSPDALLPQVLGGVAASLRLPGAEIVGRTGTRSVFGEMPDDTEDVPLVMGGDGVGVLRLARRPGETHLPPADRRLAESLAPMVAAVLQAVELAEALRIEQERVVVATETERARLRQELHDGLGPSLTGIGLGLEALQGKVGSSELVDRLRSETAASLEEVRRIIDGLRPGALETADLLSLLRVRAQHLSATTPVAVSVVAPARLPVLPPAVEGAALRIVDEALTNVVRHAGAASCTVTVALDDALRITVRDDGRGYAGPRPGGVGVASMAARAEQLGGRCEVTGTGEGTTVDVVLPVAAVPAQPVVTA